MLNLLMHSVTRRLNCLPPLFSSGLTVFLGKHRAASGGVHYEGRVDAVTNRTHGRDPIPVTRIYISTAKTVQKNLKVDGVRFSWDHVSFIAVPRGNDVQCGSRNGWKRDPGPALEWQDKTKSEKPLLTCIWRILTCISFLCSTWQWKKGRRCGP
jgi:hypothetical protein